MTLDSEIRQLYSPLLGGVDALEGNDFDEKSTCRTCSPIKANPKLCLLKGISAAAITLFVIFIFYLCGLFRAKSSAHWETIRPRRHHLPTTYDGPYTKNEINSTLGFGKVFVLNLPHRLDKKDELSLMGFLHNIDLTFLHSRLFSDLKLSGLPYMGDWYRKDREGQIGSWRAHVDTWQHIVNNKIQSALVLEDDSDWDQDLHYALQQLHQPLAAMISSIYPERTEKSRSSTQADPWLCEDWDVIYLGSCMERPFKVDDRPSNVSLEQLPHLLYTDKTVADAEDTEWSNVVYFKHYGYELPSKNLTISTSSPRRLLTVPNFPLCTTAYAISLKGAAKLLYHSTRRLDEALDAMMAHSSQRGQLRSFEVLPPIIYQWKAKDAGNRNSDLEMVNQGDVNESHSTLEYNPSIGQSESIKNSLRQSLPRLVNEL